MEQRQSWLLVSGALLLLRKVMMRYARRLPLAVARRYEGKHVASKRWYRHHAHSARQHSSEVRPLSREPPSQVEGRRRGGAVWRYLSSAAAAQEGFFTFLLRSRPRGVTAGVLLASGEAVPCRRPWFVLHVPQILVELREAHAWEIPPEQAASPEMLIGMARPAGSRQSREYCGGGSCVAFCCAAAVPVP